VTGLTSSFPCCKIEIYDTSNNLVRTIVEGEIIECHTKDIVTSAVGTFSFTIPVQIGLNIVPNDIGNNYKAKIYYGYDSTYVHTFTGKILPLTTKFNSSDILRFFEGKSLGEILERRFKYNKRWQAVEADDIAAEVASDLGLTSSLDTDTTVETVTVRTETYFDLLKTISDYWVSAGVQLVKDFYVDKDNVLQWHDRPLRTGANVESFTYGIDFEEYNLKYDILSVKNRVTVYGAAKSPFPLSMDDWTDALTDWSPITGTLALHATAPKAGTYWIKCTANSVSHTADFYRIIPRVYLRDINKLRFWHWLSPTGTVDVASVFLYAPDASNAFTSRVGAISAATGKHYNDLSLGESAEYDVDENPTGIWEKYGSPNWMDINGVEFLFHEAGGTPGVDMPCMVDKLFFYPARWLGYQEDATSQTAYGIREAEYTDDNLMSAAEAQTRAETLLYQQKDRLLRLDFSVRGNTNVLVGDRLTVTLPPDELTSVDFDVVSVENHFVNPNYRTVIQTIQGVTSRQLPSLTPLDGISRQLKQNREVTAELYSRIVR
jgi:hypothetical protein